MRHLQEGATKQQDDLARGVRGAVEQIQQAVAGVPGLLTLKRGQRRRLLKMRPGAERHVRALARLATERPQLRPNGLDPAAMVQRLDHSEQLAVLAAALRNALQSVEDTILSDGSL